MNFVSKKMLAIALLLSIPVGLLSSQAPAAKTATEVVAPFLKDGFNKLGQAGNALANSQGVQQGWQVVKESIGLASAGIAANAKVILPATLKYAFFTWAGDGSYADITCSSAAKVAVLLAGVKSVQAFNDAYAWWYGPGDTRSWFEYFTTEYDRKKLKKKPLIKESVALGLALMFIMNQTSNKAA